MSKKHTLKQKHDWFKRCLGHLDVCTDPTCELYWMFKKFLKEASK